MLKKTVLCCALILALFCSSLAGVFADSGYTPHRVYNSDDKKFNDFEMMLAELAKADVVFVGEQHDDPSTHRLELAILEGLARRRPSIIVALEMFERDTQQIVDDYLSGKIGEPEFLKASRPWPNYATDYRPIIELAKAKGWKVVAGNVPRKYASQVAKNGLADLDKLPSAERGFIAAEISAPKDDYAKKFFETMSGHLGATDDKKTLGEEQAKLEKFYQAQCVKDDTMAESIANAYAKAEQPKPLIVHFNGAFHSDFRLGTAARTRQRLNKARVQIVTVVPLEQLDAIKADDYRKRGDYVVFALKIPKAADKKNSAEAAR
jgi:uncharacterized iron-regulated protein